MERLLYQLGEWLAMEGEEEGVADIRYSREENNSFVVLLQGGKKIKITLTEE